MDIFLNILEKKLFLNCLAKLSNFDLKRLFINCRTTSVRISYFEISIYVFCNAKGLSLIDKARETLSMTTDGCVKSIGQTIGITNSLCDGAHIL